MKIYKPITEEFALFDNLPSDLLFETRKHVILYDISAWGKNAGALKKYNEEMAKVDSSKKAR